MENKVKWFASYLGADVEIMDVHGIYHAKKLTIPHLQLVEDNIINARLVLKPIESVTDDIIKMVEEQFGVEDFKNKLSDFSVCIYRWDLPRTVHMINFLKSRGYIVEWNVRTFVQYGWLKKFDNG